MLGHRCPHIRTSREEEQRWARQLRREQRVLASWLERFQLSHLAKRQTVKTSEVLVCSTIGVYLDQPAGILNYIAVQEVRGGEGEEHTGGREVQIWQQVRSSFKEKLIPGMFAGDTITLYDQKERRNTRHE